MLAVQTGPNEETQAWVSLIAKTAQGDQAAFGTFYDLTSPRVHGLVLKMVRDPSTAEEVTLDVFTQVWRQAHTYDEERGSPIGWLLTLARSRAIDRIRAVRAERGRQAPVELAETVADERQNPEEAGLQSERRSLVQQALARLSPEQREAIALAYFSGLSQTEVAAKLALPLGTVKTRMRLGLMKLRDLLASHEEGLAL